MPIGVILPIFRTHISLNTSVTRTQADEAWEPSNTVMFFRTLGSMGQKQYFFSLFLKCMALPLPRGLFPAETRV